MTDNGNKGTEAAWRACLLSTHFTEPAGRVFALKNMQPELSAALLGRYARNTQSIRDTFLDEFGAELGGADGAVERAQDFHERVFLGFGDDSVAQLCTVTVAVEGASQIATKVLERSRLMSYLEQSTRAIDWSQKINGQYRYFVPPELGIDPALTMQYRTLCDELFDFYAQHMTSVQKSIKKHMRPRYPSTPKKEFNYACKSAAFDLLRSCLPLAAQSSLGIVGSAQSFEALLHRLYSHPLEELRFLGVEIHDELKKMIPTFVKRVDVPDRGGAAIAYKAANRRGHLTDASVEAIQRARGTRVHYPGAICELIEFDRDWRERLISGILFEKGIDLANGREIACGLLPEEASTIIQTYGGWRSDRRLRPGRWLERAHYTWEITCDYGAFRDLQRHRMLNIEWQRPDPRNLGWDGLERAYELMDADDAYDLQTAWEGLMIRHNGLVPKFGGLCMANDVANDVADDVVDYVQPLAANIRFYLEMNAREAMHVCELRSKREGHWAYRKIVQDMYQQIRCNTPDVAELMRFVDENDYDLARLSPKEEEGT